MVYLGNLIPTSSLKKISKLVSAQQAPLLNAVGMNKIVFKESSWVGGWLSLK